MCSVGEGSWGITVMVSKCEATIFKCVGVDGLGKDSFEGFWYM